MGAIRKKCLRLCGERGAIMKIKSGSTSTEERALVHVTAGGRFPDALFFAKTLGQSFVSG